MSTLKVWIDQDLCTGDGICVELQPGIFAMHAPPYFAGFVIAQLFACGWLLVATFVVALIGRNDG